jgi:hypothetical protein
LIGLASPISTHTLTRGPLTSPYARARHPSLPRGSHRPVASRARSVSLLRGPRCQAHLQHRELRNELVRGLRPSSPSTNPEHGGPRPGIFSTRDYPTINRDSQTLSDPCSFCRNLASHPTPSACPNHAVAAVDPLLRRRFAPENRFWAHRWTRGLCSGRNPGARGPTPTRIPHRPSPSTV